ncbi:hypothetical protein CSA08_03080 [Candidatus Gracilibacteria bacterium]|nr:MAG: hypothetical protein CSA08_03080 [Candidatus Gracilibacteria bacterium]
MFDLQAFENARCSLLINYGFMKNILNILLIIPIILYILLLFINLDLLSLKGSINLFWLTTIDISIISFTTIFFLSYILIVYLLLKFSNLFTVFKNKALEGKVNKLKATIQDGNGTMINELISKFDKVLEKNNQSNEKILEKYKKVNDKTILDLTYEIGDLKRKIEKIKK